MEGSSINVYEKNKKKYYFCIKISKKFYNIINI